MSERNAIALDRTALPGLDRLSQHMRYLGERARVIAGNLANIDTPGYRARELEFTEELEHAAGKSGTLSYETSESTRDDEVPDEDGNTVSLEAQIARMDENTLRFRSLGELLSRRIGLLRYAAGDGRG
ncbi:MAG: flagellar biosynthesis protein FlgB [Deltaproteobacteria bacterium]|nr:flagellar biosynthesis protein FlgB [Nannocystaceae bacterium]